MTKLATVTHSRDGYRLHVVEVPLWAYAVERASEWVCGKTGDVLCAAGLPGWTWMVGIGRRNEDGWPRWNIGSGVFAFGQWIHTIGARRETGVYSAPLTVEQVEEFFPEKRMQFLEES